MTEADWWKALAREKYSGQAWLVFADWLEERGDPRSGAARRVAREGKRPYVYHGIKEVTWWRGRRGQTYEEGWCHLPEEVWLGLKGGYLPEEERGVASGDDLDDRSYPGVRKGVREAYQDLLDALVAGGLTGGEVRRS